MDIREKNSVEMNKVNLIDVSSEDDCLIASPSGSLPDLQSSGFLKSSKERDNLELYEAECAQDDKNVADLPQEGELAPPLSESFEPERTRKFGKCNLRKSLAWDSAFFTSAGVLDPEELSMINDGFKKAETHPLPAIQEDMRRSNESISTLDSDNLTLECLEVELFEDIRASIQRSNGMSTTSSPSSNVGSREPANRSIPSSKKVELASRTRVKQIATSKRQSISLQGSDKYTKESSVRQRAIQAAARSGEQNQSFLKPPRISGNVNPTSAAPTKRTSLDRAKVESITAKAGSARGASAMPSKKPGLVAPCSVTPRCTPSPKPSSVSSPSATTKVESKASCSSSSRSGTTSSDSIGKSPPNSRRNKIQSRNMNPASSGSTIKTPLKLSSRNKTTSESSRLSAYLMSVSKRSSSISPASSIDGWSTESSSSTSTVNQRSNCSKASIDIGSPHRGLSLDANAPHALDQQKNVHDQPLPELENHESALPSQCAKKASLVTGIPSRSISNDISRSAKPSGLRMPSPKIGFFDAEKSLARTSSGSLQFHSGVRSGLPKQGPGIGNLSVSVVKTKPRKIQPANTVRGPGIQHAGMLHPTTLGMKSTSSSHHHESSKASPKLSGTSAPADDRHCVSSEVQVSSRDENGSEDKLKSKLVAASKGQGHVFAIDTSLEQLHGRHISDGKENLFHVEQV
ncbi:PREDICTED: flocculation protein FLO11-like [Nelumbo nucifera]|uniref:Flocculation protein FLO11-like n=2 Tax=Nelumbo nucifera TaxID=4432 RepID=A0A1U7ZK36_NELNU|nr:PREDICTED: flocculation protein FLO11-like [Nelumbo nucifera]DAD26072.1 TPA_asm: hypothetical protein HUJ06_027540 [Nelumbo nucifera]